MLKSAIELAKTMENADLETQIIFTDIKTKCQRNESCDSKVLQMQFD